MQKFILILASLLLFSAIMMFFKAPQQKDDIYEAYTEFQRNYQKYDNSNFRYAIFKENYLEIQRHNADTTQTYQKGVNQFTDLKQEEFEQTYLMMDLPDPNSMDTIELEEQNISASIDWREKGAVYPVQNQGSCGSCWAFSVTGVVEGIYKIRQNKLPNLSKQQLVDCCIAPKYQCQGCRGAWPDWAMAFVKDNGIVTSDEYPYKGVQEKCSKQGGPFKINSFGKIPQSEEATTNAVNKQPVSIVANASQWGSYRSGIFGNCPPNPQNHAILLVGYTDTYWLVKNSWGAQWGEGGYIKLQRPGNTCGLTNYVVVGDL